MQPFVRIIHRALEVDAARRFYAAVLGGANVEIVPVPAAAVERGAPSHWLGAIGVGDVGRALADFVAAGATQLGPVQEDARGPFATARDPGGALVAFTPRAPRAPAAPSPEVGWSHLDARGGAATFEVYARLFGWRSTGPVDFAPGRYRFACEASGPSVGSYAEVAPQPGRHPQWLFQFYVAALDPALAAVRAHGGVILADLTTPGGVRVVVCDDPQGGGFALSSERRPWA